MAKTVQLKEERIFSCGDFFNVQFVLLILLIRHHHVVLYPCECLWFRRQYSSNLKAFYYFLRPRLHVVVVLVVYVNIFKLLFKLLRKRIFGFIVGINF